MGSNLDAHEPPKVLGKRGVKTTNTRPRLREKKLTRNGGKMGTEIFCSNEFRRMQDYAKKKAKKPKTM